MSSPYEFFDELKNSTFIYFMCILFYTRIYHNNIDMKTPKILSTKEPPDS